MWDLPTEPIDMAVGFSNVSAAREMVRYLAEKGHRRIGFLGGASELDRRGFDRFKGYQMEMKALGLERHRVVRLGEGPVTMSHGAPAMAELLERWPDTQAVMCVSDMSAFGAIMACQRRGMAVPGDIAVAGFGNFEIAACCHPTITTVSVDAYGIGRRAGDALLAALADEEDESGAHPRRTAKTRIQYSVVERESA
jgi:LacI family gluconate utilization system Gnt-I transcriptional repressor